MSTAAEQSVKEHSLDRLTPECDDQTSSSSVAVRNVLAFLPALLITIVLLLTAPLLREVFFLCAGVIQRPIEPEYFADSNEIQRLNQLLSTTDRKLKAKQSFGKHLIINTSENRFFLMSGRDTIREGLCSTGSYVQLKANNEQEWLFQTPRGLFRILRKTEKPVWNKPDWAFIEEGLPVPPPGSPERLERGVLGDYSLSLGSGYLIHGTLYQRFIGIPVTHGCIRLGDDDLKAVFYALSVGSRVFIY